MIITLLLHCTLLVLAKAVDTTESDISATTATTAPYPRQTGIVPECNRYHRVVNGDNCWAITRQYGINIDDFYRWNPAVGPACETLWVGYYVCIGVSPPTPKPTTTTVKPTVTCLSPTQSATAPSCTEWYEARPGDTCISIVTQKYPNITLSEFMQWNPSVGNSCQNLLAGYCYCVAVPPTSQTSKPSI
ncbi:hypothetical protein BJX96DRAFT_176032 [Aspergillus floccosus]